MIRMGLHQWLNDQESYRIAVVRLITDTVTFNGDMGRQSLQKLDEVGMILDYFAIDLKRRQLVPLIRLVPLIGKGVAGERKKER